MAGNKFRNHRTEKKQGKEEEIDIEKNDQIKLMKDSEILTKPKDDEKYRSNCSCKIGNVLKVIDVINNKGNYFIKVEYRNDKGINYGYIPYLDKEGNKNMGKYVEEAKKNNEKKTNHNLTTYGSIRLSEAIGKNEQSSPELINCLKKSIDLRNKLIDYFFSSSLNKSTDTNPDLEKKKKKLINYYLVNLEICKFFRENKVPEIESIKSFVETEQEKGIQIALRPLDYELEKDYHLLYANNIGHMFAIYFDKKEAKYKVIESLKNQINGHNKIFFRDFRKEDLAEAKIFASEELSPSQTFESLMNYLQNKYGKDECNRGIYSLIGEKGGNCYDTVTDVLEFYEKPDESIKKSPAVKYRGFLKLLKQVFENSLLSPLINKID